MVLIEHHDLLRNRKVVSRYTGLQERDIKNEECSLLQRARAELTGAGLFDDDADYGSMLGDAVMELLGAFADQGHSGCSAEIALELFNKLARHEVLTPLTSNSSEWRDCAKEMGGEACWQSTRQSNCFSRDAGKTWYCLDNQKMNNGDSLELVRANKPPNGVTTV